MRRLTSGMWLPVPAQIRWELNGNWDVANFPGFGGSIRRYRDLQRQPAHQPTPRRSTNIVSASKTVIATLNFTNTTSRHLAHVTQIPSGVTLTVSGANLTVGDLAWDLMTPSRDLGSDERWRNVGTQRKSHHTLIGNTGSTRRWAARTSAQILDLSALTNFIFTSRAPPDDHTVGTGNRSEPPILEYWQPPVISLPPQI